MKIIDMPTTWPSSTCSKQVNSLSPNSEFQIGSQNIFQENHLGFNVRPFESGMDLLNHLEDIYLRMINNGYLCNVTLDTKNSSNTILKFSRTNSKNEKNAHTDLARVAINHRVYCFHIEAKQFVLTEDVFVEENSFTVVLKSFLKIARWPDGANLVCALHSLLMKLLNHGA
jgi:hypothetical protein